jgi:uncharacterized membrane protein
MLRILLINSRVFSLLTLALALSLYGGWMVNAKLDYGYTWLYGFYETEQHIARYAPQNRFRQGFETTSVDKHKKLFQQIVVSVHANGEGLADITYEHSGQIMPLLHEAERIHLQDVANLINGIHSVALCGLLVFIICFLGEYRHQRKNRGQTQEHQEQASTLGLLSIFVLLLILMTATFFIWGAKAIFYQMHTLVFPDDHQWFFYYQDSLMSTLMKAPDLFAGIAIQILLVGLIFYGVMLSIMKKILQQRHF